MNKMKLITGITLALGLGAGVAQAAPIPLPVGPLYVQFNNLEQIDLRQTGGVFDNNITVAGLNGGNPQGNWGVFNVSTMQNGAVATPNLDISGGTPFFTDGGIGGNQVYGVFYGIDLVSGTRSSGGVLDLYWSDVGTIGATCLNGSTCGPSAATVTQFTAGTFLARLNFASGSDPLSNTNTITSSTDVTSNLNNGQANGFANVDMSAGGVWASALNGNWFTPTVLGAPVVRDVRFSTFYNSLSAWDGAAGIVGVRSNDPLRVMTVPEPATLALVGLGLLGIGFSARRKNKTV